MTLRRVLLAALLVIAASVGSCAPDAEPPAARATKGRYDANGRLVEGRAANVARPNVILLCMDTVRADAIDGHVGAAVVMPEVAAFAKASTWFIDASSPASWTAPCLTSMLTGLMPRNHGVGGPTQAWPLVAAVPTLAECLRAAGYRTAGLTGGGWVSDEMGLAQGFDTFSPTFSFYDAASALERWSSGRDRTRPFFLFLHTYDAHDPYGRKHPPDGSDDPVRVAAAEAYAKSVLAAVREATVKGITPEIDRREFALRSRRDPLYSRALAARVPPENLTALNVHYLLKEFPSDPKRVEVEALLRGSYEAGLRLLDAGFARVMRSLDEAVGTSPTVLVVLTDHGEHVGEHGRFGHGRWLSEELDRTLLTIRAPGIATGPVRGGCTGSDVLPTILELCGLPIPDSIDGRSLVSAARAPANGELVGRVIESEDYQSAPDEGVSRVLRLVSARTTRGKFLATYDPSTSETVEEVFDLTSDPKEERPLGVADLARVDPALVPAADRARVRLAAMKTETLSTGKPPR